MNHFLDSLKRIHFENRQDPVRDWLVLLALSGFIFIAIVIWNIVAFETVANGGAIGGAPTASPTAPLTSSSLQSIHTLFNTRANEAAKYETGVYHYSDPSQ